MYLTYSSIISATTTFSSPYAALLISLSLLITISSCYYFLFSLCSLLISLSFSSHYNFRLPLLSLLPMQLAYFSSHYHLQISLQSSFSKVSASLSSHFSLLFSLFFFFISQNPKFFFFSSFSFPCVATNLKSLLFSFQIAAPFSLNLLWTSFIFSAFPYFSFSSPSHFVNPT
jgi:hypothetical protein